MRVRAACVLVSLTRSKNSGHRGASHGKDQARDRGEVQPARPHWRCGVTDQPMDYRDYLIRQQQQDRIRQQVDALFTKDEDHAAAATQGIENLAYHTAQEAVAAYDYVQESLTDLIAQNRDLRARIQSGTPEKEARKLLADLRKRHAEQVAK